MLIAEKVDSIKISNKEFTVQNEDWFMFPNLSYDFKKLKKFIEELKFTNPKSRKHYKSEVEHPMDESDSVNSSSEDDVTPVFKDKDISRPLLDEDQVITKSKSQNLGEFVIQMPSLTNSGKPFVP